MILEWVYMEFIRRMVTIQQREKVEKISSLDKILGNEDLGQQNIRRPGQNAHFFRKFDWDFLPEQ